jgi:hypothetical protein
MKYVAKLYYLYIVKNRSFLCKTCKSKMNLAEVGMGEYGYALSPTPNLLLIKNT